MKDFYEITIEEKIEALRMLARKLYFKDLMAGNTRAWLEFPGWIFFEIQVSIRNFLIAIKIIFFMPMIIKIQKYRNYRVAVPQEIKDRQRWLEQNTKYREKALVGKVIQEWFRLKHQEKNRNELKGKK